MLAILIIKFVRLQELFRKDAISYEPRRVQV